MGDYANFGFDDGEIRGSCTRMTVKPKIVAEGGRTFLRIVGSPKDKSAIPPALTKRNRSTIQFTSNYRSMSKLTDANREQTYRIDLRVVPNHPSFGGDSRNSKWRYASIWEFYQYADGQRENYSRRNGIGPACRFLWRQDNHMIFEHRYNDEETIEHYDLGYVEPGSWHTYGLDATWSYDPRVGKYDVYMDGELRFKVRGKPTNLGPKSSRIPMVKVGLYGDYAIGTVDVDNLRCNPANQVVPAKPRAPVNLRLVPEQGGQTASIKLAWVAVTEDIDGRPVRGAQYKVYHREDGTEYDGRAAHHSTLTEHTWEGLTEGRRHFFKVTAIANGLESAASNEVSKLIPLPEPEPAPEKQLLSLDRLRASTSLPPDGLAAEMFDGIVNDGGNGSYVQGQSLLFFDFDLGNVYQLTRARLHGDNDGSLSSVSWKVLYRVDQTLAYVEAFSEPCNLTQWYEMALSKPEARFVRVEVTGSTAGTHLRELELYGIEAPAPPPAPSAPQNPTIVE
jgi:Polysaccharide lyase